MAQHEDVRIDAARRFRPRIDQRNAVFQLQRRLRADRASGRETQVADDDVGAGLRHVARVLLREHVRRGQQVHLPRGFDDLDFKTVAHPRLFELRANSPVEQTDRRKILDSRKSQLSYALQEVVGNQKRICAIDAREHRRVLHHRQYLARHVEHDLVRVAVGHQTGERAAAGHAVAAGAVDHDEIDAAGLLALGGKARARAAADDRLAAAHLRVKLLQDVLARDAGHWAWAISLKLATSASAKAASLMCCGSRINFLFEEILKFVEIESNSALSAAGSQKGLPGASMPETPPSGMRKRTGPCMRLSFSAMKRPMRAISSAVVRIRVTLELCLYRFLPRNCAGTVSMAQKFTMSSAPHDPTYGIGFLAKTSMRVGPAVRTPPTSSSAISVVVTSSTPARRPESTSFSIDWPPVPVAWNTMQS